MEEDEDGGDLFVPLRLFLRARPRDRHGIRRERDVAEHVTGRREHGGPSGRGERGGRTGRRERGLEVADIVAAAMAVADAEGTDAVSMRRIAREVNAGTMSLYWHVESKEELLQLMLEKVQAEAEAPEPSGDWRADLCGYAHNTRAALLRHPWAIDFIGVGPPSGPNDARNAERLMAALDPLGLDIAATLQILMTVGTYVLGAVLREIQEIRWHRNAAEMASAMTQEQVGEFLAAFNRRIHESGRYPHIAKIIDAGIDPDAPETRQERFDFGLDCVLDGIMARLKL